jgi:hypothetical protein
MAEWIGERDPEGRKVYRSDHDQDQMIVLTDEGDWITVELDDDGEWQEAE